jgi:putative membrane protein
MEKKMKVRHFTVAATLALALAACGQNDSTSADASASGTAVPDDMASASAMPPPAAAMSGQEFANAAAASDAFEIASAKLAATNAQSAKVKSFAQDMIKDHTDSTAKLKAAGASASPAITPDPTLKPEQQQQLDELKGKTGADFDTAYAAGQVSAHQQAVDMLKQYSAQGDVPQLKSFADTILPTITHHLDMAKDLP